MRVKNQADLSPEQLAVIDSEVSDQRSLVDVINWALSHPKGVFLRTVVADVIVQDEYTHDVIVPYRDGLVLVYDTT